MGDARRRGSYAQRKANPKGPIIVPEMPDTFALALVEKGVERVYHPRGGVWSEKPMQRRATPGAYLSRDGRTAYHYDGIRLTRAMPQAQNTEPAA